MPDSINMNNVFPSFIEKNGKYVEKYLTKKNKKRMESILVSDPPPYEDPVSRSKNRRRKVWRIVHYPKEKAAKLKKEMARRKEENEEFARLQGKNTITHKLSKKTLKKARNKLKQQLRKIVNKKFDNLQTKKNQSTKKQRATLKNQKRN